MNKHVESFGVFSWIRVQLSAPPPILISDFEIRNADLKCESEVDPSFRIRNDLDPHPETLNSSIRNPKSEIRNSLPIGIFDSGVGGLTVYRALHERLPTNTRLSRRHRTCATAPSRFRSERYAIENSKFLEAHGSSVVVA